MSHEQEIASGMLQWEPGSLSTTTLERVLTDALADLYGDSFRRGESRRERNERFLGTVKRCVQAATGVDLISLTATRERR